MLIREVVFRGAPFGLAPPGLAVVAWVRRPWALACGWRGWPGSRWTRRVMSTCSQRSRAAARAAQACWRVSRLSLRVVRRATWRPAPGWLLGSAANTARQAASRSADRPRRQITLLPCCWPQALSGGHSLACPASARGWRTGPSPDSARKAARPSLPEASLIAQAEQILPQAIHDARDQGLTWTQIGELLNTTAATAARRYRNKP